MAKKNSKSRTLSAQEQSLWKKVTKDVVNKPNLAAGGKTPLVVSDVEQNVGLAKPKPVSRKNLKSTTAKVTQAEPLESGYLLKLMQRFDGENHPAQGGNKKLNKTAYGKQYATPQMSYEKPENLPLDRTIRQKLQRGRADIEARLDLHGLNRDNAQTRLMSFLRSSWQQGFKTVIVVTGKGDGSIARHSLHSADFFSMPEQRAVLRASIGDWLNSHEAEQFVIGWQPAHPKHGGGGAVYVRLRSRSKRGR